MDHEKHLKAAVWWGLPQLEAFLDLHSPETSFPGSNFLRIHLSTVSLRCLVGRCESLLGDHQAFCHGQLNPKDRLHSYITCGWLIATCAEQLSNCLFRHSFLLFSSIARALGGVQRPQTSAISFCAAVSVFGTWLECYVWLKWWGSKHVNIRNLCNESAMLLFCCCPLQMLSF